MSDGEEGGYNRGGERERCGGENGVWLERVHAEFCGFILNITFTFSHLADAVIQSDLQ